VDVEPHTPVCYRHPDRETRLACSECGRPICVECSIDSPVGQKCPECARPEARARVIRVRPTAQAPARRAPATYTLIAINVVVFMLQLALRESSNGSVIANSFAQRGIEIDVLGEWWRAFTAMFLHADPFHLLVNMYALWILGPIIERRFGPASFAALYTASGLAGSALFHAVGAPDIWVVGASGAIFGLFGVLLAASFRRRHSPGGAALFNQLLFLLAINLALPLLVPRIAWQAHLGGLAAGMLLAVLWERVPLQRAGATVYRVAAALAVAGAALATVLLL
jgi:membrane associated rhomboid family serine protease